ncbi:unnamed protein product, partial [Owenia fusiformis]
CIFSFCRCQGLQHEVLTLKQQLEDVRGKSSAHERTNSDTQDKIGMMLSSLREENDKTRAALTEKTGGLNDVASRLREDLRNTENRKSTVELELRHVSSELSESHRRVSVLEASVEVANR